MNSDSSFLKALNKESLPTPPIWYMRQAGRYMPEYQNVRKKFKNFLDMCKEPDICCELALQPINAFELDAAILFSDILTIPDSFGLGVEFIENEGPVFKNPISNSTDIKNLNHFDPESLDYVYKAVNNIKSSLPEEIPLIGFCGSPWTLAAYSIEGRSSKNFEKTLNFLVSNQKDVHNLFENKWCVLIKDKKTNLKHLNFLNSFWKKMGSKVVIMNSEKHDKIFSITSHLPHLVAYNLVKSAQDFEKKQKYNLIKYSAGGLRDFSRIAASNEIMWRDIFFNNNIHYLFNVWI